MRLSWSDAAIDDLSEIAERAPRAANHLWGQIEWLAQQPFPWAFRQVPGHPGRHFLTVPPYVVVYAISGDTLLVRSIEDARRRVEPWE